MSQLKDFRPRSFSRSSTGRSTAPVGQYPRAPFPTIAALLIDPDARTIRTVYLRPTDAGLRKIFGDQRVTYADRDYYRAYGTNQCPDTITNRTILPAARTSVLGKVLITGPKFTDIIGEVSDEILKDTLFCRSDDCEPDRIKLGYSSGNISK